MSMPADIVQVVSCRAVTICRTFSGDFSLVLPGEIRKSVDNRFEGGEQNLVRFFVLRRKGEG